MLSTVFVLLFLVGIGNSDPIVHGKKVLIVEHPFVVHLKIIYNEYDILKDEHNEVKGFCGGTIVTRKTILTAAHCLTDSLTRPEVEATAGAVYKKQFSRGQTINMATYDIHPFYETNNIDIALVHLEKNFVINDGYVELARFIKAKVNDVVTVTGWGLIENDKKTEILRKATMKIQMTTKCRAYRYGTEDFHCLLDPSLTSTFCGGDSGGPLISDNKVAGVMIESDVKWDVSGLVPQIIGCAADEPAIAVKITGPRLDWIRKNAQ